MFFVKYEDGTTARADTLAAAKALAAARTDRVRIFWKMRGGWHMVWDSELGY